jgi:antirestriction protein ArdC
MPAEAIAPPTTKATVFDIVTQQLIDALERGTVPWRKKWDDPRFRTPRNLTSGKSYQGINFFLLALAAERFSSPYWLTFKQALERGGHVRKGETGAPVFFWKVYDRTRADTAAEPDDETKARRFVARYYTVFNVEQCEGVEYPRPPEQTSRVVEPLDRCDQLIASYAAGLEIRHGGAIASYSPIGDLVRMPERNTFHIPEAYYATLFHELTHHADLALMPILAASGRLDAGSSGLSAPAAVFAESA